MQEQMLQQGGDRTWAVVLGQGDEVHACLGQFARTRGLSAAHFTAIGAFERCTLGYFQWDSKRYRHNPVERQVEVVSLVGDIALDGDRPKVHMHVVLGTEDGSALAGHLLEGHVRPTLEIMLTETPATLRRQHDPVSGLALIRPNKEPS